MELDHKCFESWTEKLIADKQKGLKPKVIFVKSVNAINAIKSLNNDDEIFVVVELTTIKNNMTHQIYRHAEPPCWKKALWLVEKAGLPYWGIMLESGPYHALLQGRLSQDALSQGALSQDALLHDRGDEDLSHVFGAGRLWSLPPILDEEDEHSKQGEALNFYAEKLRYTIPMATPMATQVTATI